MKKLDKMNSDELMDFWAQHHHPSRKVAREMFPNMPKGHVKATRDLACYALNLATFRRYKEDMYKDIAERIYIKMPIPAQNKVR